jgi:outer membrane protein assembly factor BamA
MAGAQQPQASDADRLAPQTRAGQIELERRRKAASLQPNEPDKAERVLDSIQDNKIIERITAGAAGFRVRFGGMIERSGLALGPEYYRHDLMHERLRVRASAIGSIHLYYVIDSEVGMPSLAGDRVFWNLEGIHRDYPHVDYYGPGPDSRKTGRSSYLLEDTSFQFTPGIKPLPHLRLGAIGRYLMVNVSSGGEERIASADRTYTEQTTPGLTVQSNFLVAGGFIQYDWRDNPGGPRRGGNYSARYTSYSDALSRGYAFSRTDLEVQQYIPFFNERRVIALRGRMEAADPHEGNRVPFYLQPTLGGAEDLRGFRPFRFYGNSSVVLNGEYRWEVFSGLDMALFADAGRVFDRWQDIDFRELERDYGFGFRFNVRNDVFMRIDTGFSREGFQVWVKFGNVF